MSIRAGVIVAVAFEQVDSAPDTEGSAQGDHQRLKDPDSRIEKRHRICTSVKLMEGTLFLVLTDAPRPTRKELRRANLPLSPDTLPPAGASGDGKGNALCQRRFAYRNRMYSKGILSLTIL